MFKVFTFLGVFVLLAVFIYSSLPAPKQTTTKNQTIAQIRGLSGNAPLKWGAYVGWQPTDVSTFESKVGRPVDILATFVHWGNENQFPLPLANIAKAGNKTLVIFWEAMDYNVSTPEDSRFSYDAILNGNWNTYITSFAQSVKDYGAEVILIPFEEANGDWYPSSGTKNGNSPAKHIQAYRYLRGFFTGIPNVKFGWDMNQDSVPDTAGNSIPNYYPGDSYVDYVGVNGFNFDNPWQSFNEVFDVSLKTMSTFNKPIYIFSMACANGPQKAAWIKDALGVQVNNYPNLVGWVWFNENKEKDWRVWSNSASLDAFKSILPAIVATPIPTSTVIVVPTLKPIQTPTPTPTPSLTPSPTRRPTPTPRPSKHNRSFFWWQ